MTHFFSLSPIWHLRDATTISPVWQAVRGTLQQRFSTGPLGGVCGDPVIQAWGTNESQALRRQAWMRQPAAVSRSRRPTTCGSVKFINTARHHLLLQWLSTCHASNIKTLTF